MRCETAMAAAQSRARTVWNGVKLCVARTGDAGHSEKSVFDKHPVSYGQCRMSRPPLLTLPDVEKQLGFVFCCLVLFRFLFFSVFKF